MLTADSDSALRLVEIEGRGRALVASQPLKAGQIVLRDSPIVVYSAFPLVKPQSSASYCDNCFRTLSLSSSNVMPCPSCSHHHLFCSNCLTAATASSHTPWVCQALGRLRDCSSLVSQPLERQVQARFLIAAYNLAIVSPSDFQVLLSLQGQDSPSDASAVQFLHSLISSICPPPSLSITIELTAALLAKDKLNAFGLMEPISLQQDGLRSVRAYGIYPKASFFNHDCLPNACRFDYLDSAPERNTDFIVRMIHDVPQGREICLSYFPVNLNYSARQKRLAEDYGFICDCDRCKVEANWSDNEAEDISDNGNVEEEEGEEIMDEGNEEMMSSDLEQGAEGGEADFPHAYFFVRYMCNRENCGGTLAPLPPSDDIPSKVLECNVCGNLKNEDDE
ncbi:Histone-lysine N-methyltransferase ASHR2 [Hibiscus syriacus]|uniref:Histone-lysine N-methyltransferase ASHR2 n=1 Tax=Hibiscus syriacus TaxID=106335 RepID=A0A6A2X072_HIBSY|nr:histone-lysine N-methyltransferase ASHR2 [Hibiscus syriacus]KAE8667952.1 Histone-lysine N-methyltransferase ASHR2 [Hibiscus syriacus]